MGNGQRPDEPLYVTALVNDTRELTHIRAAALQAAATLYGTSALDNSSHLSMAAGWVTELAEMFEKWLTR